MSLPLPASACQKVSKMSSKKSKRSFLRRNQINIYLLLALAVSGSAQVLSKSVAEESEHKQGLRRFTGTNIIQPKYLSASPWIPLKNFKSLSGPETMKTSETLMQPTGIQSLVGRLQQNQQQQETIQSQLPIPASAQELGSSRVDLSVLIASCAQLPSDEAQRQCRENYHQLQDVASLSQAHFSLNFQSGFQPSKFPPEPQPQQHLDTSASVMNTMKAANLYNKRATPLSPLLEAVDMPESDSSRDSDSDGAESNGNNYNDNDDNDSSQPPVSYNRARYNAGHRGESSSADDDSDSSSAEPGASNSRDASLLSPAPRARRLPSMRHQTTHTNEAQGRPRDRHGQHNNAELSNQEEDPSAAERNEQEAAEASEAEAADRAALDEQQQAQQEIIKAQAASEAKAIKEQQEALMMQQRLHQQIVLRRQHDLAANQSGESRKRERQVARRQQNYSDRQQQHYDNNRGVVDRGEESRSNHHQQAINNANLAHTKRQLQGRRGAGPNLDIQFSDQPDNNEVMSSARADEQDEVGDYSVRQASISPPNIEVPEYKSSFVSQEVAAVAEATLDKMKEPFAHDLHSAAQHQYGSNYDSLKGHQSKYYQ